MLAYNYFHQFSNIYLRTRKNTSLMHLSEINVFVVVR